MATYTSLTASHSNTHALALNPSRIRVVVIEDSPDILDTVCEFLRQTGRVEILGTANNGHLGVELALSLKPDLVVTDVNMPVMNGFTATEQIKEQLPDTSVLIMSADDDPELGLAAMECGADGFMPKASLRRCRFHLARMFPF